MARTAHKIQGDIKRLIENSDLAKAVSGKVYRGDGENGERPRDSRLEDIVVIFTAGIPDQIHEGVVTVNIFVPDIDVYGKGELVEDGKRCEELESEAEKWYRGLRGKSDYLISLEDTIHTSYAPELHQHFIVVSLRYRCFEEDY